jgi:hypothetical protein
MSLTEGEILITLLRSITTRFTDAASRRSSEVHALCGCLLLGPAQLWLALPRDGMAYRFNTPSIQHSITLVGRYAGISRSDNTPQGRNSRLYQGSSVAESYGSPLNGVIVLALALAWDKVSQTTQKGWISCAGMGAGPTTLPLKEKQEFTKCYTGSRTDGFL